MGLKLKWSSCLETLLLFVPLILLSQDVFFQTINCKWQKYYRRSCCVSYCEDCVTSPCFDWHMLCQTWTLLNKIRREFAVLSTSLNSLGRFNPNWCLRIDVENNKLAKNGVNFKKIKYLSALNQESEIWWGRIVWLFTQGYFSCHF